MSSTRSGESNRMKILLERTAKKSAPSGARNADRIAQKRPNCKAESQNPRIFRAFTQSGQNKPEYFISRTEYRGRL